MANFRFVPVSLAPFPMGWHGEDQVIAICGIGPILRVKPWVEESLTVRTACLLLWNKTISLFFKAMRKSPLCSRGKYQFSIPRLWLKKKKKILENIIWKEGSQCIYYLQDVQKSDSWATKCKSPKRLNSI